MYAEELRERFRQRTCHGNASNPALVADMDTYATSFSPGMWLRYQEFLNICPDADERQNRLVDLEHWPSSKGGSFNHFFPPQLTHATVWSFQKSKVASVQDHCRAQCLRVEFGSDAVASIGLSPMLGTLLSLPRQAATQLVGNGIHIDTWSMWLVYCWANTRRAQVGLCVQMSTVGDDQVDKLDDGHNEDWLAT